MSKFELSLAKDYVPDWTIVDAVRELFQNALDQQTTVEGNKMFFDYDPLTETLNIGNKLSVLNVNTLLLGTSTKRGDDKTIGQFGEGYKIATLVLTRLNKKVTFFNYGAKEVWKPRFVVSRRYGGSEVLTFFVDKKFIWQKVPDNDLTITIENINPEEYGKIVNSNLHCQEVGEVIETNVGRMLLGFEHVGKVYVNGLFVCDYKYDYGYDFKPKYLKIDRDRKMADSFNLEWVASQMCAQIKDHDIVVKMIQKNSPDVRYISSMGSSQYGNLKDISDKASEAFREEHGENAVPVTSQDELEQVGSKYKAVYVSSTYSSMIKSSNTYEAPKLKSRSPKNRLEEWVNNHKQCLTKRALTKLNSIMSDIKE